MKAKHLGIAAVALLAAAQMIYSLTRPAKPPADPRQAGVPRPVARPADITAFSLSGPDGGETVRLARKDGGWVVESLHSAPADPARVAAFLETLLTAGRRGLDPEEDRFDTGLRERPGVAVSLWGRNGRELSGLELGLRPEDSYDAVYAKAPGGDTVFRIAGDLRAEMGLWRNISGAAPGSRFWLDTAALSFDPAAAVSLRLLAPDHRIEFVRDADGEWLLRDPAPGGEWSPAALADWLEDLSRFQVLDVASPEDRENAGLERAAYRLDVTLADGSLKSAAASRSPAFEGIWVETSDRPWQAYLLPYWRFQLYFLRMESLFPAAAPAFNPADVLMIDIRRGGESVKLSRRLRPAPGPAQGPEQGVRQDPLLDGRGREWRTIALPYPPKREMVDRLVRFMAGWRPLDYADPGDRMTRPAYGGPLLEITLAGDEVHQYRLGGRHPVFPWRYVMVDGSIALAAASSEIATMFPDFVDILEMGRVFSDIDPERAELLELTARDSGEKMVSLRRVHGETDFWEAEFSRGTVRLDAAGADAMVGAPLQWAVAGIAAHDEIPAGDGLYLLRIAGGGREQNITVLQPTGRDIPFLTDQGRMLLLGRSDLFSWLGKLRDLAGKAGPDAADDGEALPAGGSADAAPAESR